MGIDRNERAFSFGGTIRVSGDAGMPMLVNFDPASLASFVDFCKDGTLKEDTQVMRKMFSRMASQVKRRIKAVGYSGRGPYSIGSGPGKDGHTRDFIISHYGAKKLGGYARVEVGFVNHQRFYKARLNEDGTYKMWTESKMKYGPALADDRPAVPGGRYVKKSESKFGKYRGVLPGRAPFDHARKAISEIEMQAMTAKAVISALRAAAKRRAA